MSKATKLLNANGKRPLVSDPSTYDEDVAGSSNFDTLDCDIDLDSEESENEGMLDESLDFDSGNFEDNDANFDQECFHTQAYVDLGDANHECEYCGALFWYAERVKRHSVKQRPKFSMCCNKGNIVLPAMQQPPKILNDLIFHSEPRSKHFL
ncbi:unnamed protein product, partial [Cuscuta epithymum]